MKTSFPAALGILMLLFLAGCGGGGGKGASVATRSGHGRATLKVTWPNHTRLIPDAANSIVVVITDGTKVAAQQTLPRPASGGTSTADFPNLPTGTLTVTATAYPNADGTGVAQATATAPLVIVSAQTTTFTLTMASTIDHLDLTAPQNVVGVNSTLQFLATAKDASGAVVLITPGKLTWNSSVPTVATVSGTGLVTGIAPGQTNISVTDTESGKGANTDVTVRPIGPVTFQSPTLLSVNSPNETTEADFDGDGKMDIVVGTSTSLVIFYGKGNGTFEPAQTILTGSSAITPYSHADMNGDGRPDVVCVENNQILVITAQSGRAFATPITIDPHTSLGPLVTGDFHGTGRQDIAVTAFDVPGSTTTHIYTYQNQGGGSFVQGPTLQNGSIINGLKAADINSDGKVDLLASIVTSQLGTSGAAIYTGDGAGNFTGVGNVSTGTSAVSQIAVADFNGNGTMDFAIADYSDGNLAVVLNSGGTNFGTPTIYGGLNNPDHVDAVDFDRDGRPDLVVQNRDSTSFVVLRNVNGLFPNQIQVPLGVPAGPLSVADLNGDGKPDVIVSSPNGNSVAVVLNITQ